VAAAEPRPPARAWGVLALAFYAVHATTHLQRGHPEDLLWACHLGVVCVGAGLLGRWATANAIGFLWLCLGDVLWLVDLAAGGEFIPTSMLTHLGGLALAAYGVVKLGMPRHSWWKAILAFLVLQQICRWATPPEANVNVAFAVWRGWEELFPSYLPYLLMLMAITAAGFALLEHLARRLLPRARVGA
jgi:hypothetical protein